MIEKNKIFILFIFAAFVLISCEKENIIVEQQEKKNSIINDKVLNYIESLGFSTDEIEELEDCYLVEGDIAFPKKLFNDSKQSYNNGGLVSRTNINNIKIYLDEGDFSLNFATALNTAINNYNAISNTHVSMTRTYNSSNASIRVDYRNLGRGYLGQAGFPVNGRVHSQIWINETELIRYNYTTTNHLAHLLEHEIGHCIGLRHTNKTESGQIHIPTTPTRDANSIMNQGETSKANVAFSAYDIRSLQVLYSQSYHIQIGGAVWANTKAITNLNGYIYMVQNSRLYKVNPSSGGYSQLGGAVWTTNFKAMTSLGSYLYIVENSRLYRVNPNNGSYSQLGGAWWTTNFKAMTSLGSYLYIVENSRLYRVNPNNGSYSQLGGAVWTNNVEEITSLNGYLYIVENDRLYKVNPNTGGYSQVGSSLWSGGVKGMTAQNGWLYIIEGSYLHKVNPGNGGYVILGWPTWGYTYCMTSMNNKLYVAENSRLNYIANVD